MRSLRAFFIRLAGIFGASRSDRDLSAEIESHLQFHIDDNIRAGMTAEEARRQAVIALGSIEGTKEAVRDRRGIPIVESLLRDARYAIRTLRRDSAFTTFAILIIGIGVGASATVFGVVNAMWLRPLPFEQPDRLVWIANGSSANRSNVTIQVSHAVDLREQSRSFAAVAGFSPFYNPGDTRWTAAGGAERVTTVPLTGEFLSVLGVRPMLGRNFTAEECQWGAPRTAILSHAFWQRRLGARPDAIGASLTLDDQPTTIVGVMPASFDFAGTFSPGRPADLFLPYPLTAQNDRRGNTLELIGRLKPGVELAAAIAETTTTVAHIVETAPEIEPGRRRNGFRPIMKPLREHISGDFTRLLSVVAGAVGFLLLLVAANVSSLLIARAASRRKEVALRIALGAGRARVAQQMVVEGLMLSCGGAVLGLSLAFAGTRAIASLDAGSIPLLSSVTVDAPAVLFVGMVALIAGVAFGVLPALQGSESTPQEALRESSRVVSGSSGLRRAIVVTEIVLVCVLLTGAGLLTRSLLSVLDVDPGFAADNVITLRVDPARQLRLPREARNAYFDALSQYVRAVPGVEAAGLTDALPLGDNSGWRTWSADATDRVTDPSERVPARPRMVDAAYMTAMRIRVKSGRGFTAADQAGADRVMIINDSLARALWTDQEPLGRTIRASNRDYRVIGVVSDVRYFALERETGPEMYMLLAQTGDYENVDLVVKSATPVAALVPLLRAAVKRADASLPAVEFRTLEQLVDRSTFTRRVIVMLLTGFAVFGLVLAALGLYAVIAYSVTQRTREIGVRMALGAAPAALQGEVLAQTAKLALIGLAIGLPAAAMAARGIQGLLYGVASSDPTTFTTVVAVVTIIAAAAGFVPARRASRIDPVLALRSE